MEDRTEQRSGPSAAPLPGAALDRVRRGTLLWRQGHGSALYARPDAAASHVHILWSFAVGDQSECSESGCSGTRPQERKLSIQ